MEFHSNIVLCKILKFLYLQIDVYFFIDKIPHKFSIEFKSRDLVGQSKTSIFFCFKTDFCELRNVHGCVVLLKNGIIGV